VVKIMLRIAYANDRVVERNIVRAINIDIKYLSSDRRPAALGSISAHVMWMKLANPGLGPTASGNTYSQIHINQVRLAENI
jgi:hypothetical protein